MFGMTKTSLWVPKCVGRWRSKQQFTGQYLKKIHFQGIFGTLLTLHPKHFLKQMRCHGDSWIKVLVHNYHIFTVANADLSSEIILSGRFYLRCKNTGIESHCHHRGWRSKQKHFKLWEAVHWRETFYLIMQNQSGILIQLFLVFPRGN